jgi:hypothetical protein
VNALFASILTDCLSALAIAATGGGLTAAADGATPGPEFVQYMGPSGSDQVSVRPPSIGPYDVCEPGFGGAGSAASHIHWKQWTSTRAVGAGALWIPAHCFPNRWNRYPVTLSLSRVKTLRVLESPPEPPVTRTVRAFTVLRLNFTRAVPPGWHQAAYHLKELRGGGIRPGAYSYSFATGW